MSESIILELKELTAIEINVIRQEDHSDEAGGDFSLFFDNPENSFEKTGEVVIKVDIEFTLSNSIAKLSLGSVVLVHNSKGDFDSVVEEKRDQLVKPLLFKASNLLSALNSEFTPYPIVIDLYESFLEQQVIQE